MENISLNRRIAFLVLTLLLTTSVALYAQSWTVISKEDTVNFKLSNNTVPMPDVTIWVLSQEVSGSDTILYLNRFVKGVIINQPGFLQKKVTIKPGGLVILSDTATYNLYPSAGIGMDWIFNPNTQTMAEVTSVSAEIVLGMPDSVKTITLSDGNIIQLSQRWGILSFPDFMNSGIAYNLVGIDNLRIGEYFPDHVDFAHGLEVEDVFKTNEYSSTSSAWGYNTSSSYHYQYNVNTKTVTDTSVEYLVNGVRQEYWSGYPLEFSLYTDKLVYPLVFTASQSPDVWSRLRDKFSNDTITLGGRFGIVKCYYDTLLHAIGKEITGTPYNLLSNDTLYFKQTIDTRLVWSSYKTCLGVPYVEQETKYNDNYNYTSATFGDILLAWSKSFGSYGNFFNIGLTSEHWPVVSDTNILNYQLSSNAGPMPDANIRSISKDIIGNDTILYLNRITTKVNDQYLINQPGFLQKKIQVNEDKSVAFSDPAEFVLYPSGGVGYYWMFDQSKNTAAFVENVEDQNVLGIPDRVKTILLSDGNRIKLSQKWGIISFPDIINPGINYDLVGINNQRVGKCFPDNTDYALGWDVGDVFLTREGSILSGGNGDALNEVFTKRQFTVKEKTLSNTSVSYLVDGFQWEEIPQEPVSYFPYKETIVFSLDHAPFIGHAGLGRMQDAFVNDTLMTFFNGQPYIHVVEPYFDSLYNTNGKKLVSQPFQALNNDTLVIGQNLQNGLITCEYVACPGFPTIHYNDHFFGPTFNETQTKSMDIIAWSTAEGSHGELISNPFGISDQGKSSGVLIYPNPFRDFLHIELTGQTTDQRIVIYNAAGIPVYSDLVTSLKSTFDLSELPYGFYFVKVTGKTGSTTMKVAKLGPN